jgi:hypothetical protein
MRAAAGRVGCVQGGGEEPQQPGPRRAYATPGRTCMTSVSAARANASASG